MALSTTTEEKLTYLCHFGSGRDAVHPFLVDQPNIIYETTKMEANVMFSFASLVRISVELIQQILGN